MTDRRFWVIESENGDIVKILTSAEGAEREALSSSKERVVEYAPIRAVPADVKAEIDGIVEDYQAKGSDEIAAFHAMQELAERLAACAARARADGIKDAAARVASYYFGDDGHPLLKELRALVSR